MEPLATIGQLNEYLLKMTRTDSSTTSTARPTILAAGTALSFSSTKRLQQRPRVAFLQREEHSPDIENYYDKNSANYFILHTPATAKESPANENKDNKSEYVGCLFIP